MRHTRSYYLRRLHRYLGVTIGIQFLLWTVGGLYFSWSDMDEVHGDYQRKPAPLLVPDTAAWVSPSVVIANLRAAGEHPDSILSLRLVPVLDAACWQVVFIDRNAHHRRPTRTRLAYARTGVLRPALSEAEAVEIASRQFNGVPALQDAVYYTEVPPNHEYRENALPAWGVTFADPARTTVYVAAERGTVEKFRNGKWRMFDWLWMWHVMDYESRDHIGNWLLRLFSVLGLLTICSGFSMFVITSPVLQKLFNT